MIYEGLTWSDIEPDENGWYWTLNKSGDNRSWVTMCHCLGRNTSGIYAVAWLGPLPAPEAPKE